MEGSYHEHRKTLNPRRKEVKGLHGACEGIFQRCGRSTEGCVLVMGLGRAGWWLYLVILQVFSSLDNSVILFCESMHADWSSPWGWSLFFFFFPQFSSLGILALKERSENVTQGWASAEARTKCCFTWRKGNKWAQALPGFLLRVAGFPLKPFSRHFLLSLVCFRHSVSLDQQTEVHIAVRGSSVLFSLRVYVRVLLRFCSGRGTATASSFSAIYFFYI